MLFINFDVTNNIDKNMRVPMHIRISMDIQIHININARTNDANNDPGRIHVCRDDNQRAAYVANSKLWETVWKDEY